MFYKYLYTPKNSVLVAAGFALALMATAVAGAQKPDPYARPQAVPAPVDNAVTPARIELGKNLFFDPRLSGSQWISCASCHNPALGWSDGLPTAMGDGMKKLGRATPTILNTAYNKHANVGRPRRVSGRSGHRTHQGTGRDEHGYVYLADPLVRHTGL